MVMIVCASCGLWPSSGAVLADASVVSYSARLCQCHGRRVIVVVVRVHRRLEVDRWVGSRNVARGSMASGCMGVGLMG